MSRTLSPSTAKPYGLARVAAVWDLPRSTYYARRHQRTHPVESGKRGPRTAWTDEALTERIREQIADAPFRGEGHRKVWARLRVAGVRTSKGRVLRLMRQAQLLAPQRQALPVLEKPHSGTITTDRPNRMWGIDATATLTLDDGQVSRVSILSLGVRGRRVERQAARAANRGSWVVPTSGVPVVAGARAVVCCFPDARLRCPQHWPSGRLDRLPAGITVEGATPLKGEGKGVVLRVTLYPSPVPHQRSKRGGRSLHQHLSRAVRRRAGREGDTRGAASHRLFVADAENACPSASDAAFRESL